MADERNYRFENIDWQREARTGYPEAIFCPGKTAAQIIEIASKMLDAGQGLVLATKMEADVAAAVMAALDGRAKIRYAEDARLMKIGGNDDDGASGNDVADRDPEIAVVCAGTADAPVAEEAALTAEAYGHGVLRVYDVGVAGLHRLLERMEEIRRARAIIVCAGMDGALASVTAGLVKAPVIAVPTSVGYGASMEGLSALLAMLNSCSLGVSVMNIDNGFGAGHYASMIVGKGAAFDSGKK
ncbi:MAG: nickel pincer cofactor biosynthesis protein LarB [Clostridiales Family XIII bacterium]|jgi:NCAIR mutase (PurE)-related protein|nr:nickel pincer cofactor biosynthesis protein LarB [Clostridiales Family XIII bacterium]